MLEGGKTAESGAVGGVGGHGRVQNVCPVQDREVITLGPGADTDIATSGWAALTNDTVNIVSDAEHRVGPSSWEFDKTDGAAGSTYAGIVKTDLNIDASRFLVEGAVALGIQIPALTDVALVELRLGTDASNYQKWTWADAELAAAVWCDLTARVEDGIVQGAGWNPEKVVYAAILVKFDAEDDALADILVDYAMLLAEPARAPQLNVVNLNGVTEATVGAAVDVSSYRTTMLAFHVSGTGTAFLTFEHSPDGGATWFTIRTAVLTASTAAQSYAYDSPFRLVRTKTTSHTTLVVNTRILAK